MGYLIDTCIWVSVERGVLAPADVANVTSKDAVYISPFTIAELKFGAEVSKKADLRHKRLAALSRLMHKPLLRIDEVTGDIFGSLAATLCGAGRGHHFRVQDLWLASQAIQHNFFFLTHNLKDFQDIPGLELVGFPSP